MELETRVRTLALEAIEAGMSRTEAAQVVGRSLRTVRRWGKDASAKPRGRKVKQASQEATRKIEQLFEEDNTISIREVQGECPDIARREVRAHVHRLTEAARDELAEDRTRLNWVRPGAVWATDHSHIPAADPAVKVAIALRDLASHQQLLWTPGCETAEVTVRQLEDAFEEHGAPLVLKADNGPAFKSKRFMALLEKYRVQLLPSPGYYPEFNGSCEVGNRHMKRRTDAAAAGNGREDAWEPWDMELARLRSNHRARPWGIAAPSPEWTWNRRRPIHEEERDAFRRTCGHMWEKIIEERELEEHQLENDYWARLVRRAAIGRALVAHGLLIVQRRRVRPPIKAIRAVIVS